MDLSGIDSQIDMLAASIKLLKANPATLSQTITDSVNTLKQLKLERLTKVNQSTIKQFDRPSFEALLARYIFLPLSLLHTSLMMNFT